MVQCDDIEKHLGLSKSNQRCIIIAGKLKLIIPIPMYCFCDCELAVGLQSLHMHLTEHLARGCATSDPVSTRMGDRLWAGTYYVQVHLQYAV